MKSWILWWFILIVILIAATTIMNVCLGINFWVALLLGAFVTCVVDMIIGCVCFMIDEVKGGD